MYLKALLDKNLRMRREEERGSGYHRSESKPIKHPHSSRFVLAPS